MSRLRQKLGEFGSRLAFETYVALMHDQIVGALRGYLAPLKPDGLRRMVQKGEFPPLGMVSSLGEGHNIEYLKGITTLRVVEYLAEARPDLAQVIADLDIQGARYMKDLRQLLLELVSHPEKSLAESTEYETKQDMAKATCDQCGKSWPVPKDEAAAIDKCPFCGQ